jgi:signal transduction histidine kinase/DNA-binding NarL/FixJ family response regulator
MNTIIFNIILYFILLLITGFTNLYAQNNLIKPIILTNAQDKYPLGLYLEILEDSSTKLSIEDITSPTYITKFVPSKTKKPKFGFTDSTIWVRFRLRNETSNTKEWRLEHGYANTHHIDMYLPLVNSKQQKFKVTKTGILHPFNSRDIFYHRLVFKIPLLPTAEQIVYLRIKTESSLPVYLTLWKQKIFIEQSRFDLLKDGFFLGIFFIMAGYNLFIWFFLREKAYLYYVLFVLMAVLYQTTTHGLAAQYLWPNQAWLNYYIVLFTASCSVIFALKFASTFLQTKIQVPYQHKVINFLLILWGLALIQLPFIRYGILGQEEALLAIISFIFLTILGFTTWFKGYRAARYYLLAWMVFLIIMIVWVLTIFGLFSNFSLLTEGLPVAMVILMLFLSLALADRINIFKQEREIAQADALQASQENERLVREQNILLEQQVKKRTAELYQAKKHAEEARYVAETANQAKSTFLASMSHELRTPLNGILGYAQILQRDLSITTQQQHGLNVIEQSGNHLLNLINDILDLAKVESGKIELYEIDFNLPSLLNGVSEIIKIRTEQKDIDFYLESSVIPNVVHGDERRLRQILLNLLGNAIKFTDEGSVILKVSFNNAKFYFIIEDTGIGISSNNIDNIFKPFKQVGEQQRQAPGTGLGLAISKNLVELMGGNLYVSSEINVGTQFWFEIVLPIVNDSSVIETNQQLIIGVKGKPPKILVVDDNLENRTVLVYLLSPLGFDLEQAINGREGLEKAIQWQPDLIITDLLMPEMDGFELIRKLRQSPLLKEKIIIASSASVYDTDKKKSLTVGSNSFLSKPIQAETLFEQLEYHLNLTWIYRDKIETIVEENYATDMVFPPIADLEKLYELSLIGDIDELEEQAAILAKSNAKLKPFITQMQIFLKKYQVDKLSEWLKGEIRDDS